MRLTRRLPKLRHLLRQQSSSARSRTSQRAAAHARVHDLRHTHATTLLLAGVAVPATLSCQVVLTSSASGTSVDQISAARAAPSSSGCQYGSIGWPGLLGEGAARGGGSLRSGRFQPPQAVPIVCKLVSGRWIKIPDNVIRAA